MIGSGFRAMFAFLVIQHPRLPNPSQFLHRQRLPLLPCVAGVSPDILLSDGINMFVLDCWTMRFLGCAAFEARLVAASPRPDAAAPGGRARRRRGAGAAAEVRRLRGSKGRRRPQTPELSRWELCRGDLALCQVILKKQNEGKHVS